MKILHSAPLDIEISPRLKYAGTERILLYLNKGLSLAGHNSVVAAPGNSDLGGYGTLLPTREKHLWSVNGNEREIIQSPEAYELHYEKCMSYASNNNFDVLHDHPGDCLFLSKAYKKRIDTFDVPVIMTAHGPVSPQCEKIENYDEAEQRRKLETLREFQSRNVPVYLITISKSHKEEHEAIENFAKLTK